jgi:hypothetical protein
VVECVRDCDARGFRLLDVRAFNPSGTTGSLQSRTPWGEDIDRVMLVGGVTGSGVITDSSSMGNVGRVYLNIGLSGFDSIDWARPTSGGSVTSTVMVIRWGNEWTVQCCTVTGTASNSSGNASAYDTVDIDEVPRANTWVWGTGFTLGDGHGNSAEGSIITLGDGTVPDASVTTASQVAVGQQSNPGNKLFTVYALTHPELRVDHRFRPNGESGTTQNIPTNDAAHCGPSSGGRMAVAYNGGNSTSTSSSGSNNWPSAIWSSRYHSDTSIRMSREQNSGINWTA